MKSILAIFELLAMQARRFSGAIRWFEPSGRVADSPALRVRTW
jgi:hypothetical protein